MKFNPEMHHRRSIRLKGYDYSQNGLYFITICSQNRVCLFGNIVGANPLGVQNIVPLPSQKPKFLVLNEAGIFVNECWLQIPQHFPNVILHKYVIMPNHIHGIIELITNTGVGKNSVGVQNFEPLPSRKRNEFQKIIPRSIGSIVRGFKIGVTKWFHKRTDIPRVWERNYYEHIIRNENSYKTITEYIVNNPQNWDEDKFYCA